MTMKIIKIARITLIVLRIKKVLKTLGGGAHKDISVGKVACFVANPDKTAAGLKLRNPAPWLRLAAGGEFTQPKVHIFYFGFFNISVPLYIHTLLDKIVTPRR